MVILAIDPGLASLGYGVVKHTERESLEVITYGCIHTKSKHAKEQRLYEIYQALRVLVLKYHPSHLILEKLYFAKNVKTALSIGESRGVILLLAGMHHVPVEEFTPLQVKQTISGFGRASKHQVQDMVQRLFSLKEFPSSDDAADALAIAYTFLQHEQFRTRVSLRDKK